MTTDNGLTTLLDDALERQSAQEPLSQILADYPLEADQIRPLLQTVTTIEILQPVTMPSTSQLNADRENFLAHVANLPEQAVSPSPFIRLKGWMAEKLPRNEITTQQKEHGKMIPIILKAALILTMIVSGAGGTAVISASTLPGSPLYPIKLGLEDTRLALAGDAQARAELHLTFAQERADEIQQMAQAGQVPSSATQAKLQTHWQQALQWMAKAPAEEMEDLMAQAQIMAQNQHKALNKVQTIASGSSPGEFMAEVQAFLTAGQEIPNAFRMQNGVMNDWNNAKGPFGSGDGSGPGNGGFQPGPGYGPGPAAGNGPGDGDCDGNGDCEGDGNGPGPGAGNGPGDGDCDGSGDCDGDGNGPGPGAGNGPGDGDCNGNGECDGTGPAGGGNGPGPGDGDGNGPGPGDGDGNGPGPGDGDGYGNGPGDGDGPVDGNGNGPTDGDCSGNGECDGTGPAGGGNGPGPGDGDCDGSGDCDDDGNGPGPGDGDGNGPGPGDDGGPGPGDGDCDGSGDCDGDGNGPGPGDGDGDSSSPGPGESGDNGGGTGGGNGGNGG